MTRRPPKQYSWGRHLYLYPFQTCASAAHAFAIKYHSDTDALLLKAAFIGLLDTL